MVNIANAGGANSRMTLLIKLSPECQIVRRWLNTRGSQKIAVVGLIMKLRTTMAM